MTEPPQPTAAARRLRVDALRNRERIVEVARDAFTRHGAQATLDEIARRAGIGPGTLYRHFPTREALIEEVYRSEVEKLTAAGQRYSLAMRPLDALRSWMLLFIDHVARKSLILPAYRADRCA
jgi:AcrR family transcriptional regulator